jgi:hypothetical protein
MDLQQELSNDPKPLQTIMSAYLKLVNDANERRKPGDPWPVVIIDEANRLSSWKDKEALEQLLAFFVYLTKQRQLAHGMCGIAESPFTACDTLVRRASKDISRALTPAVWKGAAWSTKQCRKALHKIASSPHPCSRVCEPAASRRGRRWPAVTRIDERAEPASSAQLR